MLTLQTKVRVDGITGTEIFDFLADPNDGAYQRWWPGTHLQLHVLERHQAHVGDVIYMDEYVGSRRLRMRGIVLEAVPGEKLVWRLKKVIKLPARLSLEFADYEGGVAITHTVQAGLGGAGPNSRPPGQALLLERVRRGSGRPREDGVPVAARPPRADHGRSRR